MEADLRTCSFECKTSFQMIIYLFYFLIRDKNDKDENRRHTSIGFPLLGSMQGLWVVVGVVEGLVVVVGVGLVVVVLVVVGGTVVVRGAENEDILL